MKYKFDCGCEVNVVSDKIKDCDGLASLHIDYYNLEPTCLNTWDLISSGRTKGVFQLESQLGQQWAKNVAPKNMSEIAALISIMRPGCISGDTKILIKFWKTDTKTSYKKIPIRQLYKNKKYYQTLISYDEENGNLLLNQIKNVLYTGDKEVFKIKIRNSKRKRQSKNWYNLECTEEHKLLTPYGWKELRELKIGDRFAGLKINGKSRLRNNYHGEKYFREICFKHYEYRCVFCDWLEGSLDVNHLDDNRKSNNHPDNLCFLCPNHHRLYSENKISKQSLMEKREQYKLPFKKEIEWLIFEGKESLGIKDVYDITMSAPNHNFIAGNIVVHNCLEAEIDGVSLTQLYVDRKNGEKPITYISENLRPILEKTYGILVFQEQALQIAKDLAGFNLQEAEILRKAIGKKKPEIMAKAKLQFLEKAEETKILSKQQSEDIFGWIQAGQRYSFNASHSYSYGMTGYWSAWAKYHFPIHFYTSWLYYSKNKIDSQKEVQDLIMDAQINGINIYPPSLSTLFTSDPGEFCMRDDKIYFGISHVKGIGLSYAIKLIDAIQTAQERLSKSIDKWTWYEFLTNIAAKISSTVMNNIIAVGLLSDMKLDRSYMIYEYNIWQQLTDNEKKFIQENLALKNLREALIYLKEKPRLNFNRSNKVDELINAIDNPPFNVEDTIPFIASKELDLLGVNLTCTKLDLCDTSLANSSCLDVINGKQGKLTLAVEIVSTRYNIVKSEANKGKKMMFLTLQDSSGSINGVIFWNQLEKYQNLLYNGNTIFIHASPSNKQHGSVIINDVKQL